MKGDQPKRANITKCPVCHNRMQCDLRVSYVVQMGCPLFLDESEVKWYVKFFDYFKRSSRN